MTNTNPPSLFSPRRVQTEPDQETQLSLSPERVNMLMQPTTLLPAFRSPPSKMVQAKNSKKHLNSGKLIMSTVMDPRKKAPMSRASSLLQEVARNPQSWKRDLSKTKDAEREQSQDGGSIASAERYETPEKIRFMSPLSLPDKRSPVKVGSKWMQISAVEYLVRMFDGQLCQTKEERANCILNPLKPNSPKTENTSPRFTKSQNQFNQNKTRSKDLNPITKDPRDSRRISCKAPMPGSLLSFDLKRITDLKKLMVESGLATPGLHMKAKLAQGIRETPQIDDSYSERSSKGRNAIRHEGWKDKSKLMIDTALSVRSLGQKDEKSSTKGPSTPRSFKVPHSRIPCFPRTQLLPPSRQSRSHSPILFEHPQSSKQRLGIVGQSLNTLRGLKRQIAPPHRRTIDQALQTEVFESIEKLVLKSLSSDSEHQEEVEDEENKSEAATNQISQIDLEELGSHRRVATEPEEESLQWTILPRVTVKPLSQFTPDISELRKVVQPKQILNTSRLIAMTRRTNLNLRNYEMQKQMDSNNRPGTFNTSRSFKAYFRNLRMFSSHKSESPSSVSSSFTNTSTPTKMREMRNHNRKIPSLFSSSQQSPRLLVKQLANRVPAPQFGLFPFE